MRKVNKLEKVLKDFGSEVIKNFKNINWSSLFTSQFNTVPVSRYSAFIATTWLAFCWTDWSFSRAPLGRRSCSG